LIWTPRIELINRSGFSTLEEELIEIVNIKDKGVYVIQHLMYQGGVNSSMDLRRFPFDEQKMEFILRSEDFSRQMVVICPTDEQRTDMRRFIDHHVSLHDFHIIGMRAMEASHCYAMLKEIEGEESAMYSDVRIQIHVHRKSGYYLNKVWAQYNIISIMDLFCIFLPYYDIKDRDNIALVLFLTAVALSFTSSSDLPRISYRTRLDNFVFISYILYMLIFMSNFTLYRLTWFVYTDGTAEELAAVYEIAQTLTYVIYGAIAGMLVVLNIWFMWPYLNLRKMLKVSGEHGSGGGGHDGHGHDDGGHGHDDPAAGSGGGGRTRGTHDQEHKE